jgi:PIN domain nuclease of toxin-antitoxin system
VIAAVADTHTAIWHLFNDDRLSPAAAAAIANAADARQHIAISAISLVEIVYLVEKGRLPEAAWNELRRTLDDPEHVFIEAGLTAGIVEAMKQVLRSEVPDMADRIIAATAAYLNVPVISRDRRIRAANLQAIW